MGIVIVTGNVNKAKNASKALGQPIAHVDINLPEIQSLDLREIVEYKLKSAYEVVQKPVIVDDVSLEFAEFKRLPGTFVKFFEEEIGLEAMCRMLDGKSRRAVARCMLGFTDGKNTLFFEGALEGEIARHQRGNGGFGWDRIFMPDGYGGRTDAELSPDEYNAVYMKIKRFDLLKKAITSL